MLEESSQIANVGENENLLVAVRTIHRLLGTLSKLSIEGGFEVRNAFTETLLVNSKEVS